MIILKRVHISFWLGNTTKRYRWIKLELFFFFFSFEQFYSTTIIFTALSVLVSATISRRLLRNALTSETKSPSSLSRSVKSLFDSMSLARRQQSAPRANTGTSLGSFNSPNEIYDYHAKVEWGSIDHTTTIERALGHGEWDIGVVSIYERGGPRRRFYWRVCELRGTLNPKGGFLATPSQVVQVEGTVEDRPLDQFSARSAARISSASVFPASFHSFCLIIIVIVHSSSSLAVVNYLFFQLFRSCGVWKINVKG